LASAGFGEDGQNDAESVRAGGVDVSVVIVSWNVRELLRACIKSLNSNRGDLSIEIIVIDNASDDRSVEAVETDFPDVQLIASRTNLGFSRANNVGLRLAKGRYVFFLNPDTVLHEDALSKMVDFLEGHQEFDLVGPKLVFPDGSPQWVAARRPPSPALMSFHAMYLHRLPLMGPRLLNQMISHYDLNESQEVEAISGAAMLGRRSRLEKVGGFDESFLYTGEDVDLCLRLRELGSRIFYLADATVVHIGGQSSSQAWGRSGAMVVLSTERYLARSHGRFQAVTYRLVVQLVQIPIMLLVGFAAALLGRSGPGNLRQRLAFAKAVWRWRVDE
jgi:GT2 family glycosyltransferase